MTTSLTIHHQPTDGGSAVSELLLEAAVCPGRSSKCLFVCLQVCVCKSMSECSCHGVKGQKVRRSLKKLLYCRVINNSRNQLWIKPESNLDQTKGKTGLG